MAHVWGHSRTVGSEHCRPVKAPGPPGPVRNRGEGRVPGTDGQFVQNRSAPVLHTNSRFRNPGFLDRFAAHRLTVVPQMENSKDEYTVWMSKRCSSKDFKKNRSPRYRLGYTSLIIARLLVSRLHGKQPEPELTAVRWRCTVYPICPLLE